VRREQEQRCSVALAPFQRRQSGIGEVPIDRIAVSEERAEGDLALCSGKTDLRAEPLLALDTKRFT
jgi:hypothetical protein